MSFLFSYYRHWPFFVPLLYCQHSLVESNDIFIILAFLRTLRLLINWKGRRSRPINELEKFFNLNPSKFILRHYHLHTTWSFRHIDNRVKLFKIQKFLDWKLYRYSKILFFGLRLIDFQRVIFDTPKQHLILTNSVGGFSPNFYSDFTKYSQTRWWYSFLILH